MNMHTWLVHTLALIVGGNLSMQRTSHLYILYIYIYTHSLSLTIKFSFHECINMHLRIYHV